MLKLFFPFKLNRFDESYPSRIGIIELNSGIVYIIFFLIKFIIPEWTLFLFLVGMMSLIVALMINHLKSRGN